MTDLVETFLILYIPLLAAVVLLCWMRIYPRLKVAIVLASLWQVGTLPWLDHLAQDFGFWTYHSSSPTLVSMPITAYCGWITLWGVLATLMLGKLPTKRPLIWTLCTFLLIDFSVMPLLSSQISLSNNWLVGELFIITFGLLPGLALAHWTLSWSHLCWRSFILSITFGLICITLTPFLAGHTLVEITQQINTYSTLHHLLFCIGFFFLTSPAVQAIQDLTRHGKGTPIPIDPTRKLVTFSVYSYIANPMQFSIILSLLLVAAYLQLIIFILLAVVAVIYCVGFARWSEEKELSDRFGDSWRNYRKNVRCWFPQLEPNLNAPSTLYIDLNCTRCKQIADWFTHKNPTALVIQDASTFKGLPLKAITYQYPDGNIDQSVAAVTAALQHINLGWALISWMLRYPGVSHLIQLSNNLTQGTPKT